MLLDKHYRAVALRAFIFIPQLCHYPPRRVTLMTEHSYQVRFVSVTEGKPSDLAYSLSHYDMSYQAEPFIFLLARPFQVRAHHSGLLKVSL